MSIGVGTRNVRVGRGVVAIAAALAMLAAACGNDNGSGSGGRTATVSGNVSNATTSSLERKSWLARLRDEVSIFAQNAYAQVGASALAGIIVTVTSGNASATATTDDNGD